jgi:tagatose 1,6-diphosphate aldolase
VGVAIDHRDSLRVALRRKGLPDPQPAELSALKVLMARALASAASLILLDVEYSAAQALADGAVPGDVALAVALEAQGYHDVADMSQTSLLSGWSPAAAARLGASACKLLLPFRVDMIAQAQRQEALVAEVIEQCRAAGIALILEPIVYGSHDPLRFAELVTAGAARLAGLEPDVLKVQYPGSESACTRLNEACGPEVPWVVLGGGADPDALERQILSASRAGASGFIVGRTVWDDALVPDAAERDRRLATVCLPILQRLSAAARSTATPWRARVGPITRPAVGETV